MGNRQSKRNKKTKESPRRDKLTKKRRKEVKYEPSEVLTQRTSGVSSRRGHDLHAPTLLSIVIEPKSLKKDATIADRSEPQTATTEQALPLSLEPSKATTSALLNVAECDDKIRHEGTRLDDFQPGTSHSITEPHPVTTMQALPLSLGPIEKDEKKSQGCLNEQETISLETTRQPEATTTTPAIGMVPESIQEKHTVISVEEMKLLAVSGTHSTVATPPESSGATAEAAREEKHGKGTQQESKSGAQETQLMHGAGAPDGIDHTPSKKPAQRKRHKRTGRYGEQFHISVNHAVLTAV